MYKFCLFGGTQVLGDDGLAIHLGFKQQVLISVLMLAANRTVSADVLVEYLWGEDLPANPLNSLQDVVKRLRSALGDNDRTLIVTNGRAYGLVVDPDLLDICVFKRLAMAGMALEKAEPALAWLLLARAFEHAHGELPEIEWGPALDEIDALCHLRSLAEGALARAAQGASPDSSDVCNLAAAWSMQAQQVGLALRLAELSELVLADAVQTVTKYQGEVRRLSDGILLAAFSGAGPAVRCASDLANQLSSHPGALLGGALDYLPLGRNQSGIGALLQRAWQAVPDQILATKRVNDAATTARIKGLLFRLDDELWQIGIPVHQSDKGASEAPMVGREETLEVVRELVRRHRMVTLRGPGGIGKTRIARELAYVAAGEFAGGAWFVDLATADRQGGPLPLIIRTLGLVPEPYRHPDDTLIDRLSETESLLILDNCEKFTEEMRSLSQQLIEGCPGITILTTSRSALGLGSEVVLEIGELDLFDAAQLLLTLAFPQSTRGRPEAFDRRVLGLCAQLDNVPLAIECAASMVRTMGLQEATDALKRLPDGAVLPLLDAAHGGRGRHRSIELALKASYRALSEEDAGLLERLSSLRGGFTAADAAGAVGEAEVGAGLTRLSDASLIKSLGNDRWRMLEPVRQFAATRLLRRGEQDAQAERHARYFVTLAHQAEAGLNGPSQGAWFVRLNDAYANLDRALSWAVRAGDAGAALQLTSSLWWYWAAQGQFVEGSAAVERSLAVEDGVPSVLRARTLVAASHLSWWAGNPHRTETSLNEAMMLIKAEGRDDPQMKGLEAWARTGLAGAKLWGGGDRDELTAHLEEGRRLFSSIGDLPGLGMNLSTHSGLAWHYGQDHLHYSKGCESLEAFREAGHQTMIAHMTRVVGLARAGLGDADGGRPLINEGLQLSQELGDLGGLPLGWGFLGLLEVWSGNRLAALKAFEQSITANRKLGQVWPSLLAIAFASEQALINHRPADALRLDSVVQGVTERTGIRLPPRDRLRVSAAVEKAETEVESNELGKLIDEGAEMPLSHALDLALDVFRD